VLLLVLRQPHSALRYSPMGAMFSKPKMPDTSAQTALLAKQEADVAARETQTAKRQAAAMQARKGRSASSLITGGNEAGVMRQTLG